MINQINQTDTKIYNKSIFYSFRIHGEIFSHNNLNLNNIHYLCKNAKDELLNLLSADGISMNEIIRPEIYKHDVSFNFLPNFIHGCIHLIFKPFEYIRILKNAYNISIIPWEFDDINIVSKDDIPFTNHRRMLSMVDEIWIFSDKQKDILNNYKFFNVFLISQDNTSKGISLSRVKERFNEIRDKDG